MFVKSRSSLVICSGGEARALEAFLPECTLRLRVHGRDQELVDVSACLSAAGKQSREEAIGDVGTYAGHSLGTLTWVLGN